VRDDRDVAQVLDHKKPRIVIRARP